MAKFLFIFHHCDQILPNLIALDFPFLQPVDGSTFEPTVASIHNDTTAA